MATFTDTMLREQLAERRERLQSAITEVGAGQAGRLTDLLREVDATLHRVNHGSFGLCKTCHDPIEPERLLSDPLIEYCLDHLTPEQRRTLEQDLELAARIQVGLLPENGLCVDGWQTHYHYEPAGVVSGDYCDLVIDQARTGLFFLLGDVSGKGVAASILMSHLHATFRSLLALSLPLNELVARANRLFCESTVPSSYATLVCGRTLQGTDEVEICNAGHCPPLLVRRGEATAMDSTNLPVGMFCSVPYSVKRARLGPGDTLFLYTDGLSEATNGSGMEYGFQRLCAFLAVRHASPPAQLVADCRTELAAFRSGSPRSDDLAMMAIRRTNAET